jgi:uncharacterized protein YndB with AHSA1/START domain
MNTVEVKRRFAATPEKIFDALGKGILWHKCGADMNKIQMDWREGGTWNVTFRNGHAASGKILSLVKNRKAVFTWEGNGTVTITLTGDKANTEMHLVHEGLGENAGDFDWGWRDGVNDFTAEITRKLVVEREFASPIGVVYALFASPKLFQLCKAKADTQEFDFRVRGQYRHESGPECGNKTTSGEFTDIRPEKRIAFTWNTGDIASLVLVDFEATAKGTKVKLTHAGFPDEASCEAHRKGWTEILGGM